MPWREDPAIPLSSIGALMDLPDSEDPETQYQQNVAAREELIARLREQLADDPETMAKFDELYEAARYSFPLTEDHAFYIDQLCISVFRRFVLAVGDRLVAKGVDRRAATTSSTSTATSSSTRSRTAATGGRSWPSGGRASNAPAR